MLYQKERRERLMRRVVLWMLLFVMLISLSGCTALDEWARSDALPDLRLLQPLS